MFVASLIRVVLDRPTPTVASLRGRVDGLWRRWAGNPIWAAAAAGPAGPAGAAGPGGAGGDSRCEDVHRVRLGGENPQVPLKSNLRFQWNLRTVGVSHHDTPMPVDNLRNFNGNRGRVRTCQDPQPGRSLFRAETCEPDMALAPTERRSRRYRNGPRPGQPATRLGNLPPAWATCHPPGQPATRLGNLPPAWATCRPPSCPKLPKPDRSTLHTPCQAAIASRSVAPPTVIFRQALPSAVSCQDVRVYYALLDALEDAGVGVLLHSGRASQPATYQKREFSQHSQWFDSAIRAHKVGHWSSQAPPVTPGTSTIVL
ncbi:hypothetical protein A8926_6361 [Saccharopolyspora spinosa]|uniref:Uncharacterized protein n=1 Tax=Saccharopolyspora spinosa TaxID=60894 RepID=A0A2N3Y5T8_SACSN|nr:hypothetical protein A8926_6361 [Saccharopolyspora spinosa]